MMSQNFIKSTCGICFNNCGVLVQVTDGKVSGIFGDPESPVNRGKLCVKGLASLEYLYHPNRLKYPLRRAGRRGEGRWQQISWDEALDLVASELRRARESQGAESVVFVDGSAKGIQDAFLRRFANAFGTPNIVSTDHVCFVPRRMASMITHGFSPLPDYEYPPSCILVWGANLAETRFAEHERLLQALDKGSKLVVIDPRRTELARRANLWLRPRPGSDLALALGMLQVIISEELFDKAFVDQWTIGFAELKARVQDYPPERVAEMTWVAAELIRQAARLYAMNKPACIQWGNAIDHGVNSFQTARAISILRAITGNLGRPGGELEGSSFASLDYFSPELTLQDKVTPDRWKRRIGTEHEVLPTGTYTLPASLVKAILEEKPYPIRVVYVQACNPLLTWSNAQRARQALEKVPFLVVADMFLTPTAALADVVLPVASYLECDGIVAPPYYPVVQVQQKVAQIGECRSDCEILNELAKKVGLREYFWDGVEQFLDAILEPLGLTFDEFRRIGVVTQPKRYRLYKTKGFPTSSGRVELYSSQLERRGFDPLPIYREPPETPYSAAELAKEYPFIILISWKMAPYRHSGGRQISSLRGAHPEPLALIHPQAARELEISDGDWIYIETKRGRIKQRARVTDDIHPRVVGVDYAWWFPERGPTDLFGWAEANVNLLTNDNPPYNPEMGTTNLRGFLCKVYRAGAG